MSLYQDAQTQFQNRYKKYYQNKMQAQVQILEHLLLLCYRLLIPLLLLSDWAHNQNVDIKHFRKH